MAALDLYHRLYTHAPSPWSPDGGRVVDVARDASSVLHGDSLEELDALLTRLEPEGSGAAWAMRRFVQDGEWFACVVVAYDDIDDAAKRAGLFKHARVVRLDRAEPWFQPAALIENVKAFPIKEVRAASPDARLRTYLDLIPDDASINVPALSVSAFDGLPQEWLEDVLAVLLGTHGKLGAQRVNVGDVPVEAIALAAAALPAGLQRQSSWAMNATNAVAVDVIWSLAGPSPAEVAHEGARACAARYLEWLRSPCDLKPLLSDDSILKTVDLQEFLKRIAIVTPVEGTEMATGKNKNKQSAPHAAPRLDPLPVSDDELLRSLDRQHQAIYQSLRKYIDERLSAYEVANGVKVRQEQVSAPILPAPSRAPAQSSRRDAPEESDDRRLGNKRLMQIVRWVAAVAVLVGIVWLMGRLIRPRGNDGVRDDWQQQSEVQQQDERGTEETAQSSSARAAVQKIISSAETAAATQAQNQVKLDDRDAWAVGLKDLSEQQPLLLAGVVASAANGQDVRDDVREKLLGFSARLKGQGEQLDPKARGELRPLLFECFIKILADNQVVDGKLDDIDKNLLESAKRKWGLTYVAADRDDREFQSELILRRIEDQLP